MKKTSVYLDEEDEARLKRLMEDMQLSRADVLRRGLESLERECSAPRVFHIFGSGEGDGRSIADFSEAELAALMEGFGED